MSAAELMSFENANLLGRVADLEKRSAEQANEVACLRSSLADCLRRISLLEANRVDISSTGAVANRSEAVTARRVQSKSRSNLGAPSSRDGSLAVPSAQRGIRKSSRLSSSSTALDRQSLSGSVSKDPVFISNDGILRFYLRGRAINVYLPSSLLESYDVNLPQPAPDATLKLEWVYGYRGRDCRNNLHYLPTGEIVYFVAATVVLYNIEEQSQRHYLEHTDDVKCIAIHPNRIIIATGQTAGHIKQFGKPHVRIWSSVDLRTLRTIGVGDFERSVCCVSFSKTDGGARLCAVDESSEHTFSIWEWQKGKKITESKSSNDPVVAAEFHPLDENTLVTCGKNQLTFWTLDGNNLSRKSGLFESGKISCEKPKFVLCLAFADNGDLLTGDSSGNIIVWQRSTNTIAQVCESAHDGSIFSLCVTQDGHVVSGGGKDGRLVFFDFALNPTGITKELPSLHGAVRTICQGPGDMLLIGTTKNTILQTGPGLEFSSLVFGHNDEFWALATHPRSAQFLTAGHDCLVVLWDSLSKQAVWVKEITEPVHCAAFFPARSPGATTDGHADGSMCDGDICGPNEFGCVDPLIALGTTSGRWLVMDSIRREVISARTDGIGEQIECIAYSPDGKHIALGSRDNCIYVYSVSDHGGKYSRVGRCVGHSSVVLHLDWSLEGKYLRSVSADYELLFWTVHDCRQVVSPSTLRDLEWATQTCTLGWNVIGIWPLGSDMTDVNACAKNPKGDLIATADDHGKVNLFQAPVDKAKAEYHSYQGHSSHVTNVAFLHDGSRLLSTGGKDTAILQWEVCM